MDAEDLLLRSFLGILNDEDLAASARWIRSQQRSDGTWATFFEGPGDLSTTIEAYVGLRLAGDDPTADHMTKALAFIASEGGLGSARVFTRLWMALFGVWSWDELPAVPPEIIFLPPFVPLNIYDFACWARQTIVAVALVASHRPVHRLPFELDELITGDRASTPAVHAPVGLRSQALKLLDRALHGYEQLARHTPVGPTLRTAARAACERWILQRQEADGGWGGIQPPWVYSILALFLQGYELDHPVLRAALDGLEGFTIREDGLRRLEACQSPVWDTALAMIALSDAGVDGNDEALVRAGRWLLAEEVTVRGDWAVRRPTLEPGGWAFEFANDHYPDIDDTALVIPALRALRLPDPNEQHLVCEAINRGRRWVEGMVCADGGWGAFDADNTEELCRALPFCDFGEVIDPPTADVTGHVVEMLAREPDAERRLIEGGVSWLRRSQEPDGSFFGRWGVNYVYGVGAVVPAMIAAGVPSSDRQIRRATRWLVEHQNEDGGWGEDLRSYRDPRQAGRGASTASQTAWALLALIAAGDSATPAAAAGVDFLVRTQRPDGSWDEPYYTGTGFPGDFSINYHLYRVIFPLSALGRYERAQRGAGAAAGGGS
jgi:squalene-hopene/tetraprenyl-beta-curcumene cyclase